jgi:hypothetical protein
MIDSHGNWHNNDQHLEHEKLFRIVDKLNSIRKDAYMRNESEQFILGILISTEVIQAEISGFSHENTPSIDNPNQIPLL